MFHYIPHFYKLEVKSTGLGRFRLEFGDVEVKVLHSAMNFLPHSTTPHQEIPSVTVMGVCVPPNPYAEALRAQCAGRGRCGLWEVIRIRCHEVGLYDGISAHPTARRQSTSQGESLTRHQI